MWQRCPCLVCTISDSDPTTLNKAVTLQFRVGQNLPKNTISTKNHAKTILHFFHCLPTAENFIKKPNVQRYRSLSLRRVDRKHNKELNKWVHYTPGKSQVFCRDLLEFPEGVNKHMNEGPWSAGTCRWLMQYMRLFPNPSAKSLKESWNIGCGGIENKSILWIINWHK